MNADENIDVSVLLRNAAVGYGGRATLDGLNVSLPPGGLLVLMGTNGSGKSTILKTLAGLLKPIDGEVSLLGGAPGAQPARVGYLPQHPASSFTLPLRAADVVAMGRFARLGLVRRGTSTDRAAIASAMDRTGVNRFASQPLRELSGGQQQRTHLAQVLAREADVLLLDEPTAGLDASGRQAVANVVDAERARGASVVLATHDLADAEHADIVLLLAGKVVAQGSPAATLTDEHLRECYGFTDRH
jgi:ABC-type Mn2+/Zn2+ transport system ATPase subunit